jgi:hypothetical protein
VTIELDGQTGKKENGFAYIDDSGYFSALFEATLDLAMTPERF